ncbi:MAG: hypothetical protein MUC48_14575 [Leptolyngbya sp. Prado105]|jgi:hypothetical protein|nr:hypothetical protein [Leptolyngbya sp. Prado105]
MSDLPIEDDYSVVQRGELVADPRIEEIGAVILPALRSLGDVSDCLRKYKLCKFANEVDQLSIHLAEWQDYGAEHLGESLPLEIPKNGEKS